MFPMRSPMVVTVGLAIAAAAASGIVRPPVEPAAAKDREATGGPILRGTIADESGRPVKGVKVQLYGGLATRWEGQSAVTGDDGSYRFDPLQTGAMTKPEGIDRWDYYVGVRIERDTYVPKEGESWFDLTVPNVDRQVTTRDFVMSPGGMLDGEVKMQDSFGWSGLDLRFMPVTGKGTHWYATTDRKGRFSTKAMVPGQYSVQWNSSAADYPELAVVKIEPGKRTSVRVIAAIKVEATSEADSAPFDAKPPAAAEKQGQPGR